MVQDAVVNVEEEPHREMEVQLEEVENAETIDTDAVEELNNFIDKLRVVQESEKDRGEQLERLISTLPKTIGKCSQGHTKGQMLKALRQLKVDGMEKLNGKTVSLFRKSHEEPAFWELVYKVANAEELKGRLLLFAGVLSAFSEAVAASSQVLPVKSSSSPSVANKVAVMAHTIASPESVPILERIRDGVPKVQTTAILDSMSGSKGFMDNLFAELAELAEKNKSTYDNTSDYTEAYCGKEAADALAKSNIDPRKAPKMTGAEFKKIYTESKNSFEVLKAKHDVSGENRDGVERRENIFANFIGNTGRAKDLSLYYLFLTWDGKDIRFTTRALPVDQAKSSASTALDDEDDVEEVTVLKKPSTAKKTKRERQEEKEEEKKLKRMEAFGASFHKKDNENSSSGNNEVLDASRNELIQSKISETQAAALAQLTTTRLAAISNPHFFDKLSEDKQEKLRDATFNDLF